MIYENNQVADVNENHDAADDYDNDDIYDDDDDDDIGDENDDGEDYPTKADHLLLDRGCSLPPSVFQWERPDFWQMSSHFSEN